MHIVTLEMKDHYTIMDGLELDHNLNMDDYSRQCNGLLYFQLEIGIPTISLVYLQDNQKYVHT